MKASAALDWPDMMPSDWVIWSGNEYKWPDSRRSTLYLGRKRDAVKGYALFTTLPEQALTFANKEQAEEFLMEQHMHGARYRPKITTVRDMLEARGYTTNGMISTAD